MEAFKEFESRWGRYVGSDQVVACSSGTAALHLALEALDLPPRSQVIIPDFTMVACARAVTLAGLTPLFADCSRDSMNMDPKSVEDHIMMITPPNSRKRWREERDPIVGAIMPVHVYGRSCNMTAIHELAAKHELYVIEDMAEAHCQMPHPDTDVACWSFYKNKVVFGEEGGALSFHYTLQNHYAKAKSLRSLGFTEDHDYWHIPRGHNYRMSNVHANLINNSLDTMNLWVDTRRSHEAIFDAHCPPQYRLPPRETPWVYDLRIPGLTWNQQTAIVKRCQAFGIAARYAFKPMTFQQEYTRKWSLMVGGAKGNSLMDHPHAERPHSGDWAREVIYLPLGQSLGMDATRAAGLAFYVIKDVLSSVS